MMIVHPRGWAIDLRNLRMALIDVKRSSWIDDGKRGLYNRGFEDTYRTQIDGFTYNYAFRGEGHFVETETISYNEVPVWEMNYWGHLAGSDHLVRKENYEDSLIRASNFLIRMLMKPHQYKPYRGPVGQVVRNALLKNGGDIYYINSVTQCSKGNPLISFEGNDEIALDPRIIKKDSSHESPFLKGYYRGGVLVPDSYLKE